MLEYDFEDSVGYWTCLAARALEKTMNEELAAEGITFQQWQVLAWISIEGGEMTQSELADRLKIEPPTLAGILDRMERAGWIVRETDPADRRKKIVRPTPAVEPVWKRMTACARKVRARAMRGLSPEEISLTCSALNTILDNLGSSIQSRERVS